MSEYRKGYWYSVEDECPAPMEAGFIYKLRNGEVVDSDDFEHGEPCCELCGQELYGEKSRNIEFWKKDER